MKSKKQLCPICSIKPARISPIYGLLPCKKCAKKQQQARLPDHPVEMVGEDIHGQRKAYANDIIQPWRSGEPSREFMEKYPEKAKRYYTAKERKKAKYVWDGDLSYYKKANKK